MLVSCVAATTLYPPSKEKNIVMDEQDKINTDPAFAETVETYPAPPAEVAVEKEGEAAAPLEVTVEMDVKPPPPPTEVNDQTKRTKEFG